MPSFKELITNVSPDSFPLTQLIRVDLVFSPRLHQHLKVQVVQVFKVLVALNGRFLLTLFQTRSNETIMMALSFVSGVCHCVRYVTCWGGVEGGGY